mmetsp:Transcript_27395/g.41693  ORF Transcript_27395/g.41693 Transcript_27395/m.41693 type:complete len:95 (+) Transcript_27395:1278-1562(+)
MVCSPNGVDAPVTTASFLSPNCLIAALPARSRPGIFHPFINPKPSTLLFSRDNNNNNKANNRTGSTMLFDDRTIMMMITMKQNKSNMNFSLRGG